MIPPRDQQSVEEIAKEAWDELFRLIYGPATRRLISSNDGIRIVLRAINAALTAHDEALPGDWTVVPVDTSQPTGMCFIRTREGGKLRFYLRYEQAVAVAAAHNSAMRLLVDALRNARSTLVLFLNRPSKPGLASGQSLAEKTIARLDKALRPYSGQNDGANGN